MPELWNYGTTERAADQRTVAERRWRDGLKSKAPQQPCDVGLFSDSPRQLDLVELANTERKP